MAADTNFTYEELRDLKDEELMRGTGIRAQNDTSSKCGSCVYGGMCECFSPVGYRRICDRVPAVEMLEGLMYCKVLGFNVRPDWCDSCPTCKEECAGRAIAIGEVANQGAGVIEDSKKELITLEKVKEQIDLGWDTSNRRAANIFGDVAWAALGEDGRRIVAAKVHRIIRENKLGKPFVLSRSSEVTQIS
jgi:hypothetical protein